MACHCVRPSYAHARQCSHVVFFVDLSVFRAISVVKLSLDLPCKKTSSLPIGEISCNNNHRAAYT